MKKLVLFSAVIIAVAFSSCKKTTETPVEEETAPVVEIITEEETALDENEIIVIDVEETIEVAE